MTHGLYELEAVVVLEAPATISRLNGPTTGTFDTQLTLPPTMRERSHPDTERVIAPVTHVTKHEVFFSWGGWWGS